MRTPITTPKSLVPANLVCLALTEEILKSLSDAASTATSPNKTISYFQEALSMADNTTQVTSAVTTVAEGVSMLQDAITENLTSVLREVVTSPSTTTTEVVTELVNSPGMISTIRNTVASNMTQLSEILGLSSSTISDAISSTVSSVVNSVNETALNFTLPYDDESNSTAATTIGPVIDQVFNNRAIICFGTFSILVATVISVATIWTCLREVAEQARTEDYTIVYKKGDDDDIEVPEQPALQPHPVDKLLPSQTRSDKTQDHTD